MITKSTRITNKFIEKNNPLNTQMITTHLQGILRSMFEKQSMYIMFIKKDQKNEIITTENY